VCHCVCARTRFCACESVYAFVCAVRHVREREWAHICTYEKAKVSARDR